jgi:hypothetical protein
MDQEEVYQPWSLWEKLTILYKFTHHAAYENVNTALWRLPSNNSGQLPATVLAVTDNTVAAEVDLATLRVVHVHRPQMKIGQAAHFLEEPSTATGAQRDGGIGGGGDNSAANSINYRFRFDWRQSDDIYVEETTAVVHFWFLIAQIMARSILA